MYPVQTRDNYLILTPDGVGSTYLQRALTVHLHGMIDRLHYTLRLPTTLPIKMNTMANKRSRVTNFDQAVETYNNWALKGNTHAIITEKTIINKIDTEKQIYADK